MERRLPSLARLRRMRGMYPAVHHSREIHRALRREQLKPALEIYENFPSGFYAEDYAELDVLGEQISGEVSEMLTVCSRYLPEGIRINQWSNGRTMYYLPETKEVLTVQPEALNVLYPEQEHDAVFPKKLTADGLDYMSFLDGASTMSIEDYMHKDYNAVDDDHPYRPVREIDFLSSLLNSVYLDKTIYTDSDFITSTSSMRKTLRQYKDMVEEISERNAPDVQNAAAELVRTVIDGEGIDREALPGDFYFAPGYSYSPKDRGLMKSYYVGNSENRTLKHERKATPLEWCLLAANIRRSIIHGLIPWEDRDYFRDNDTLSLQMNQRGVDVLWKQ